MTRLYATLGFAAALVGIVGMLWGLSLASLAGWTWVCRNIHIGICS